MAAEIRGPLTDSIHGLGRLVAASPAFQRRRGVSGPAAAMQHVLTYDYEEDPAALKRARPFAVIWPARLVWSQFAAGARNYLKSSGRLILVLTDTQPRRTDSKDKTGEETFAAWIDEVIFDLAAHAGEDDHLPISRIVAAEPLINRSPPTDEAAAGSYLWSQFEISWGTEQ